MGRGKTHVYVYLSFRELADEMMFIFFPRAGGRNGAISKRRQGRAPLLTYKHSVFQPNPLTENINTCFMENACKTLVAYCQDKPSAHPVDKYSFQRKNKRDNIKHYHLFTKSRPNNLLCTTVHITVPNSTTPLEL
jgi:hypothetical protein